MKLPVTTVLLIASLALSGCVSSLGDEVTAERTVPDELAAGDALWSNPQHAPHPDFAFPTYTNPPEDAPNPWWEPVEMRELPEEISGLAEVHTSGGLADAGAGIAIFGSLAIVPSWNWETTIFDISDPEEPKKLSTLKIDGEVDAIPARDVDTIAYPDGRLVAVFATDDEVVPVWDITDPTEPKRLGVLHPTEGSHNVDVVPGTPILYNANSKGGNLPQGAPANDPALAEGLTEIYDLSSENLELAEEHDQISLEEAAHVGDWDNGYGCHDITFHITDEKQRAYCAGIEYTQIWDIEDPLDPEVLVNIPVHHGAADGPSASAAPARFSHLAMVNDDASILLVGDETGGGVSPGCDVYTGAGGTANSGPIGNLYFYDISDEEHPELLSVLSPDHHYLSNPPHDDEMTPVGPAEIPAGCTAHFGRIVPDDDRDLLAIAFYGAGVLLVDFTDPSAPVIVDQWNPNTNVWDVWYHQGYLFTGDLARGMDVLTLE